MSKDQERCSVSSDPGPNCLQRISTDDKSCFFCASKERVTLGQIFLLVDLPDFFPDWGGGGDGGDKKKTKL